MVVLDRIRSFMRLEAAGGITLVVCAALAMLVANSPLVTQYDKLLDVHLSIAVGDWSISKPLLLWINDGLMAIFFLLVGLEVKREVVEGELSNWSQIALPAAGGIGGMAAPALIYVFFNQNDPDALAGWAIPAATDIAFALGVLSLFGRRVPLALKIFLLTVAIFDDLGAIIVIALFYSGDLSTAALIGAAVSVGALILLNRLGVHRIAAYLLVGVLLWVFVLKSGVHATLAGVIIGLAIPTRARNNPDHSPLKTLEHALHPWVAFGILPVFAFANAGVPLTGMAVADVLNPVPLGIALGLILGKPIGILLCVALAVFTRCAKLPQGTNWLHLLGVAVLCGIGFTMSLFISGLAFEHTGVNYLNPSRIGILAGSITSALIGYFILHLTLPANNETASSVGS